MRLVLCSEMYHCHQRNYILRQWYVLIHLLDKYSTANWLQKMVYFPAQTQEKVFRNLVPSSFSSHKQNLLMFIKINNHLKLQLPVWNNFRNSYLHSFSHQLRLESQRYKHSESCHLCLCTVHYYRSDRSVHIHQYLKAKQKKPKKFQVCFFSFCFI